MNKMDNLLDTKFFKKLNEIGTKISSSTLFTALSGGLMMATGIYLVGTLFSIIANILAYSGAIGIDSAVYKALLVPFNMTSGLITIGLSFGVAYMYALLNKSKSPVAMGISSIFLFLMVAAPVKEYTLEDGSTLSALDTTCLGGAGIFTAIVIAVISVKICLIFEKKKIMLPK